MNSILEWASENKALVGGLALIAFAAFTNSGQLQQQSQAAAALRQQRQESSARTDQLNAQQQELQAKAAIAKERYKSGCLLVVASNSPNQSAAIVQGQSVVDQVTRSPLPPNTVVCDVFGNTGVINAQLVVDGVAFTGDVQVVREAIAKQRYDANINDPIQ